MSQRIASKSFDQEKGKGPALLSTDPRPAKSQKEEYKFAYTNTEGCFAVLMCVLQQCFYTSQVGIRTWEIQEKTPLKGVVPSWFGYFRDDSDSQWRSFRENIPTFVVGMSVYVLLNRMIQLNLSQSTKTGLNIKKWYYLLTGFGYLIFLFRGGIVPWLLFTLGNYVVQLALHRYSFFTPIVWVSAIWQLYYVYYHNDQLFEYLTTLSPTYGALLMESNSQAIVPWNAIYPMTLLRVMSHNLDHHWFIRQKYPFDKKNHSDKCKQCAQGQICYKARTQIYLDEDYYDSLSCYFIYLVYLPLFITGPQITFNAFISQMLKPQNVHSKTYIFTYFLRALNNILILELYTHLHFASALSKIDENREHWLSFTLNECLYMGFANIVFIWLKFLTIWRLARAFSLLDGIDVPENMNRCIFNNYCFEEFWRSWHRGFNQWLIRYLFIPIGGTKTKVWNIWIIFTFVAIWHDFTLDLVLWAWTICLALVPEMMAKRWAKKQSHLWGKWWFKYFCSIFGGCQAWLMVLANLIGFGNGWYNMEIIFQKIFEPGVTMQLIKAYLSMYFYPLQQYWMRQIEGGDTQAD